MAPAKRRSRRTIEKPTRRSRRRDAQLAFEALSIEGGLLSPDWLARVAALEAGGQGEADYRIPKGLQLRDEIGRYWRIAQALWGDFATGRPAAVSPEAARAHAERFVTALLREAFGFASLAPAPPVVLADRSYPIGHAALGGRVPVVIAAPGENRVSGLETASAALGDGGRRRTAFGLAQEYVNAADNAVWGIASDGVTLRILRDNASLTRPAWVEASLERLFTEELYADFTALWLLLHETRFGREGAPPTECPLEAWREAGREEGTRAREHLRGGVEEALADLGQGFLAHPDNAALRAALHSNELTREAYFQQLLRLVYRLIFLLTVEERGLLHPESPEGASPAARGLYAEGYSLRRLRERAVRRSAHDRHGDLWEATKIVFRGLAAGEPRLGLPALAGLFASDQTPALDAGRLENRALLLAMFRLCWLRESAGLVRVNWRDMGPEELGSVYESLLELVPQITDDGRGFRFAQGGETRGNARKTTGSYYTPDSLVQVLLDSALEPVVAGTLAANPQRPVEALLGLTVVDPACGSGHFLLAAARRLAAHVARLQANGTPSVAEYRHALRQVVGRCLYGVDLNPMAVELCKVSLWMEAVEPGLPLTFLDSHVQRGNALLGTTPDLMAGGVPDAAWEPIEGDDRKVASALKKRNRTADASQGSLEALWTSPAPGEAAAVAQAVRELDAAGDASATALAAKEARWEEILGSAEYRHQKLVADAWCAAFVWPKQEGELARAAPTNDLWRQMRDGRGVPPPATVRVVRELAAEYGFFHWHLQFPQVFGRGGFQLVLGNPPWEHMELKEEEWFAERRPGIAAAPNAATRKRLIAALATEDPAEYASFQAALRRFDSENCLIRASGRFPLCAVGRINTYAIFAEHNRAILGADGRAGFVVPTGIATDDTTKGYFRSLVANRQLVGLYSFENEDKVFPNVHNQFKFGLITLDGTRSASIVDLFFFARQAVDLKDRSRRISLGVRDFQILNPNTGTCPTFRTRRDAEINLRLYRCHGILWREAEGNAENPWGLRFSQGLFNMASDSGSFRTKQWLEGAGQELRGSTFDGPLGRFLPLIEGKMVHQFDHRFATYANATQSQLNKGTLPRLTDVAHLAPDTFALPEYWVEVAKTAEKLEGRWHRRWLLGWRAVTRSVDERTLIASLVPQAAVGDTFLLMMPARGPVSVACLYASLCSFALDYAARQKAGGATLKYFTMKQLPVLGPATYRQDTPWQRGTALREWLLPRVLELTYTAWDLEPFARDVGWDGPPFRWDPARRFLLRAELDAAFFHLYGLSRDDTAYILDTFPIVRKHDEKAHGEYRTKRVILEVYDAMAEASRTAAPYVTRLESPPADPRVAHPPDPSRAPREIARS